MERVIEKGSARREEDFKGAIANGLALVPLIRSMLIVNWIGQIMAPAALPTGNYVGLFVTFLGSPSESHVNMYCIPLLISPFHLL